MLRERLFTFVEKDVIVVHRILAVRERRRGKVVDRTIQGGQAPEVDVS
jgi:uncharacterized protein (UPF0248 family)